MIKSIKMKNCATYNAEGIVIDNCQKVNFFYGANGSGKSTIGNFLQTQGDTKYSNCEIEWVGDTPLDVVVYNREFRETNFKENIAGVFTLGQATIEETQVLENLKKARNLKNDELVKKKETLEKTRVEKDNIEKEFKENAWQKILKVHEITFKEAFSGCRSRKDEFVKRLLHEHDSYKKSDLSKDELLQKAEILYSSKPEKCDLLNFTVDDIAREVRAIEEDTIWSKVVVGNQDVPISELIEFLGNSDWVNQGQKYIQENEICPFCQSKTITDELQTQFKSFFSGEYEEKINYIKTIAKKYQNLRTQLLEQLTILLSKENSITVGKLNVENFTTHRDLLENIFDANILEMSKKEKEAGRKANLRSTDSITNNLKKNISNANSEIANHNQMIENYYAEKTHLTKNVWSFVLTENETTISSHLKTIDNFDKAIFGIAKAIENQERELKQLDAKIVEDGKNITSIQPTVDEINRSLAAYGFTNFRIEASQEQANAYQICRDDGTPATNTLSEGEETFITFLYFMQLAKGATEISDISKKRVLILDDPICSLDSTVLYIVSSIVKDLLQKVRKGESDVTQAFILTHNVFFHKEASFIDNRTQVMNDVYYWIINKDSNVSRIKAHGADNPIKTSYELLWSELKTNTDSSKINTQNIMRRIIENYFSMIGKSINDEVVKSFNTTEEQMICRSLVSWINDGSHSINDDMYIDSYTDSVERYKEIFRAIFVNMGHEAHYEMMMKEVSQ